MKINLENIGDIVKQDERYVVKDNTHLKNLVVSTTELNPHKSTSGHKHEGQEEVYYFVKGSGTIYLDDKPNFVSAGDVVLIEDGVHHRVETGPDGLHFLCVFDGRRSH
jgi:quercetin dioxygenase-like cupin family protein